MAAGKGASAFPIFRSMVPRSSSTSTTVHVLCDTGSSAVSPAVEAVLLRREPKRLTVERFTLPTISPPLNSPIASGSSTSSALDIS